MLLRADGSVFYWGERHVDRLGFHSGWLPRQPLGALAQSVLKDDRYIALEDRYAGSWTDQATVVTSAVLDGRRKVVEDYGREAPEAAQELTEALTLLLAGTVWDPERIDAGVGARDAPSCADFRERVVDACLRYAAGDISSEMCTLYAGPAEATLDGVVPPEFCAELVRSYELAPPSPGTGPIAFGPVCASYVESYVSGCPDTLLGRPVVEFGPTCGGLIKTLDRLVPYVLEAEDEETRQSILSTNEGVCRYLGRER